MDTPEANFEEALDNAVDGEMDDLDDHATSSKRYSSEPMITSS